MNRIKTVALAALALVVGACQEVAPTSVDEGVLPDPPVTAEIRLGWDEFGSGLQVLGGYGVPQELGTAFVADDFGGILDARTLARFTGYPSAATVRDTAGNNVTDSTIYFVGGRVVARLDTLASTNTGPVILTLGALQQEWHARSATWQLAVDTINDHRPWGVPGAGPVVELGRGSWDPSMGDSVVFAVDSAQIAAWADTSDLSRGVRLGIETLGERVKVNDLVLRLDAKSPLSPDTALVIPISRRDFTFIYDPVPAPPSDGIRIGGAPSFRTVLDVNVPAQVNSPASLCQAVGCPVTLTPDRINYAAIVLRTRAGEPAFQPTDTVNLDVRPVLARDALPKAPLGPSLTGSLGRRVAPGLFGSDAGATIEIPVTAFVRDLLRGATLTGADPPRTLALLSTLEPLSISFASFYGPGSDLEPVLKLIVSIGTPVKLP